MEGSVESQRVRGMAVRTAMESIPTSKLPIACRARLLKVIRGELNFLHKLGGEDHNLLLSSNFGHFEAIVQVLRHPLVNGICAVNQKFPLESSPGGAAAHVDLVGLYDGKPAWFVVSDRNPKHNLWTEPGLQSRTSLLLRAAKADVLLQPACVVFYFARGIEGSSFEHEFNAHRIESEGVAEVESGEWLLVGDGGGESWIDLPANLDVKSMQAVMFRVDVAPPNVFDQPEVINVSVCATDGAVSSAFEARKGLTDSVFYGLLEDVSRRWGGQVIDTDVVSQGTRLVNLDTTALIGMVSGISNNMASSIATWSTKKLSSKFLSFGHFFRTQALLELEKPFLPEVAMIFKQRQPVVSEFAWNEFLSIVSVVGGPDEQRRASALHACIRQWIVPDNPSERVSALPETGRIQDKHKIVFGTGDKMEAPTLTSNISFVRAATSKGMALAFVEHRALALTRD